VQELGRLSFHRMSQELEGPTHQEQRQPDNPQSIHPNGRYQQRQRENDEWDAQGVAEPVERMLMTAAILGDPLVSALPSEHCDLRDSSGELLYDGSRTRYTTQC